MMKMWLTQVFRRPRRRDSSVTRRANLAARIQRLEPRRLLAAEVMMDMAAMESHQHEHQHVETVDANVDAIPTVSIRTMTVGDSVDVFLSVTNFELSEDAVDSSHVDGQGHAHLYVDGEKVSRVYSDVFRVEDLAAGIHTISVDLNSNDHRAYLVDGEKIEASVKILHLSEERSQAMMAKFADDVAALPTAYAALSVSGFANQDVAIAGDDAGDVSGGSVFSAGDFNNDGIDDLVIGASGGDNGANADDGEVYVVFGSETGLSGSIDLSTLNGTNGFKLIGVSAGDLTGTSVGGGGDINNDGFDDIVIGAPGADPLSRDAAGSAYVVFGSNSFGATFNLALLDGSNGFRIDGAFAGDDLGRSVAITGDVNDDNVDDFVVGAPLHDGGGENAGAAYVIFGGGSYPASLDTASLAATDGLRIDGSTAGENLGYSVGTAGDVNGDTVDDVIVGAPTGFGGGISTSCNASNTVGLIQCDAAAASGYTLFSPNPSTETYLVDSNGFVVNSWSASNRPGLSAYLLEDGSLLRTANIGGANFQAGGNAGAVEIYDWDGNLTWQYTYRNAQHRSHHDVEMLPNGNVLMIAWELKTSAEAIAAGRDPSLLTDGQLWPDHIIEVQPTGATTGDIVWEWHAWDHLIQDFDSSLPNFGVVADHPQLIDINFTNNGSEDWMHTNSIDYNPELDQILLSIHRFSEVWVIDHSTTTAQAASHSGGDSGKGGDLLYRWGNPQAYDRGTNADREFYAQHDARWIEPGLPGAGNIMAFNNGQGRPGGNASTVDEITPPVDASGNYTLATGQDYGPTSTTWTWSDTPSTDFFAMNISGAHRLDNGNTLITNGPSGQFLEVDAAGNEVFEYINPVTNSGPLAQGSTPTGNPVFRATKYDPSYAGLAGRDLSPGATVETGGSTSTTTVVAEGSAYVLFGNSGVANIGVNSLSGSNGFKLSGVDVGDQAGYSVSAAGDVNGDGFNDVTVGSPRAKVDGVSVGSAYVVLGKSNGFAANLSLDSLTGNNGYRLAGDYESDPLLSSFIVNETGATGYAGAVVNFDSVIPDDDYVHVHTSGIPHYDIGPWGPNPNLPSDQDVTFYLPRNPEVESGAKSRTRLGAIGTWIDGTAIFNWSDGRSYNDADEWNQLAVVFEAISFDACDAHPPGTGQYHTHGAPSCLIDEVNDDGSDHSPILGWSFDGFPIYGSYGYAGGDPNAAIERVDSSWQLRNITSRVNGPTLAEQPLGSYVEDFEYVAGSGDLDQYNGRFSPTPEYPTGIYHYYVTIDSAGEPAFPYTVGLEYNGVVGHGNGNNGGVDPTLQSASIAVGTVGDFNNDGYDDVVIGDPDAHVDGVGVGGNATVVYGSSAAHAADEHLHEIDATTGVRFAGDTIGDQAGAAVAAAGDVNHDGGHDLVVSAPHADPAGNASAGETFVSFGVAPASVTHRGVSYGSTAFGDTLDPTKSALVSGNASTANYTNSTAGLNRVVVDIQNRPTTELTTADFEFRVGNTSFPGNWTELTAFNDLPTVNIAAGPGTNTDRVTLAWTTNPIKNAWLQVRVKATENTGLDSDDVFYFGNQVGDVFGTTSQNENVVVNATDVILTRFNQSLDPNDADIANQYDITKDGLVNAVDVILSRFNQSLSGGLLMISVP